MASVTETRDPRTDVSVSDDLNPQNFQPHSRYCFRNRFIATIFAERRIRFAIRVKKQQTTDGPEKEVDACLLLKQRPQSTSNTDIVRAVCKLQQNNSFSQCVDYNKNPNCYVKQHYTFEKPLGSCKKKKGLSMKAMLNYCFQQQKTTKSKVQCIDSGWEAYGGLTP